MRLRPDARLQRAERLADLAVLERAMHRDQRVGRMIAERRGERDLLLGRGRARREIGRAEVRDELLRQRSTAPRDPPRSPRRSAPASTSRATRRRESRRGRPRAPCLRASAGSAFAEHERARHRPFAGLGRALEHEGVGRIEPDGAQQLHERGPPRCRIEPRRRGERRQQSLRGRPRPCRCAAPEDRRCRRCAAAAPFSRGRRCEIVLRDRARSRRPARRRSCTIRWRAKLSTSRAGRRVVEAFLLERRRQRTQARLALAHRRRCGSCAPNTSQAGGSSSRASCRPAEPPAADQPAIDADRVRPVDRRSASPAAHAPQRVGQRRHAGIEARAARCAAARPAPAPRRTRRGRSARHRPACRRPPRRAISMRMREGVADLAQRHQRERRRQVERGRGRACARRLASGGMVAPDWLFLFRIIIT